MGGHVRRGRVDDGAEIHERQLVEPGSVVVLVEGPPAAVRALQPRQPAAGAGYGRAAGTRLLQSHGDDGRVVDVRVEIVVVLERPAARLDARRPNGPVAARPNLLGDEPVRRSLERRLLSWNAGRAEAS